MKHPLIALLFVSLPYLQAEAQKQATFEKREFISGKDTLRYRIQYPEKYRRSKAYPLVVFLHGSGERGSDNEAQLTHGGALFASAATRKNFPAIVIFPQCPKDSAWSRFKRSAPPSTDRLFLSEDPAPIPQQLLKSLLDELSNSRIIDERRRYIGGLSLGGMGTYDMLIRYPDYFAAAFPICGASNVPLVVQRAKQVPFWIFHGGDDTVVPPHSNRELYKALMTAGAKDVTYTEYPKVGHNSWDNAFAERKLLPWLFSNKKKRVRS